MKTVKVDAVRINGGRQGRVQGGSAGFYTIGLQGSISSEAEQTLVQLESTPNRPKVGVWIAVTPFEIGVHL